MTRRRKTILALSLGTLLLLAAGLYYAAISFSSAFNYSHPIPTPGTTLADLLSSQLGLALPANANVTHGQKVRQSMDAVFYFRLTLSEPDRTAFLSAVKQARLQNGFVGDIPFQDPPPWFTPPPDRLGFMAAGARTFGCLYYSDTSDELFIYWLTT